MTHFKLFFIIYFKFLHSVPLPITELLVYHKELHDKLIHVNKTQFKDELLD